MRVTSMQGLMHSYASLTGYIVHLGTEGVHLCCLVKMYLSALITLIGFLTVKQRRSQTAGALIKKKIEKVKCTEEHQRHPQETALCFLRTGRRLRHLST